MKPPCLSLLSVIRSSPAVKLYGIVKIFYSVAPSNLLFVDKPAIQITSYPLFWDKDWPNFGLSDPDKKWPDLPRSSLDSDASCTAWYPSEDRCITPGVIEGKLYDILSKLMSPSLWYAQSVHSIDCVSSLIPEHWRQRSAREESSEGGWGDVLWGVCAVLDTGRGDVRRRKVEDLDGESEGKSQELWKDGRIGFRRNMNRGIHNFSAVNHSLISYHFSIELHAGQTYAKSSLWIHGYCTLVLTCMLLAWQTNNSVTSFSWLKWSLDLCRKSTLPDCNNQSRNEITYGYHVTSLNRTGHTSIDPV